MLTPYSTNYDMVFMHSEAPGEVLCIGVNNPAGDPKALMDIWDRIFGPILDEIEAKGYHQLRFAADMLDAYQNLGIRQEGYTTWLGLDPVTPKIQFMASIPHPERLAVAAHQHNRIPANFSVGPQSPIPETYIGG